MFRFTIPTKRPTEVHRTTVDFKRSIITAGELISSAVVTMVLKGSNSGGGVVDHDPSTMIVGTATIAGTNVTQLIGGGVDGHDYEAVFTIETSLGRRVEAVGDLSVLDVD